MVFFVLVGFEFFLFFLQFGIDFMISVVYICMIKVVIMDYYLLDIELDIFRVFWDKQFWMVWEVYEVLFVIKDVGYIIIFK